MAPLDDASGPLVHYIEKDLEEAFVKYDKLWEVEDPEENPYKTKYEARKLLQGTLKELERLVAAAEGDGGLERGRLAVAHLLCFLGKNLYFCEEVPEAELYLNRSLERYLRSPLRLDPQYFCRIQDVLNQLGMLWCNRHGHGEGMNFLRRAQIMFMNRPTEVRESQLMNAQSENNYTLTMFYLAQAYGALQKPALSARFCAETMSQQLDHNAPGKRSQEVREKDPFDCKDWVRNCCSLSDFFANECMFWTAEYLLHTGIVMCEKAEEICGFVPENLHELHAECLRDLGNLYSTRLKFAKTCTEKPELCEEIWRGLKKRPPTAEVNAEEKGSRLTFRCSADRGGARVPDGGTGPIIWDTVFPEVVFLEDEEADDNRLAEEDCVSSPSGAAADGDSKLSSGWLELGTYERVRLPVYFKVTHDCAERRMRRANAAFLSFRGDTAAAFETAVAANAAARGAEEDAGDDAEGESGGTKADSKDGASAVKRLPPAAATTFEAAREIFKLSNHYFGRAMEHFKLDGWVTEHVRILQELSQMYRTLQCWEKDPKRAAAMLRRRVRMLAPLLDLLNPRAYVAFWRQISFEAAEIEQELYELKACGKLPRGMGAVAVDSDGEEAVTPKQVKRAARLNEIARRAIDLYTRFVDNYHQDGKIPQRIDDDNVRAYLNARVNRARLRTKMRGLKLDEQVEANKLALREYEWIQDYARRNPEVRTKLEIGMSEELHLCDEMAEMLPSKLSRLAAQRR